MVRRVCPPVRLSKILSAGDYGGAQRLVTGERQEVRVHDGAAFRACAAAVRAMTLGTVRPENLGSGLRVAGTGTALDGVLQAIGRKGHTLELTRPPPP